MKHPKMKLKTQASIVRTKPLRPVFAFRPHTLIQAASYFINNFQGKVLYAVKTNPEEHVIRTLNLQGITAFDVASLEEIRIVKAYAPDAELFYMHPIKSPQAIAKAYFEYGVRHYALDCLDELNKILENTHYAEDLILHLRLSIPNTYAELNLSEKFGAALHKAPDLLRNIREYAAKLGVTFHVGSQCMHPDAYRIAMKMVDKAVTDAEVAIDYFNVGGGFPSIYPGMIPPPLREYFRTIHYEFAKITKKHTNVQLLCEPGRALVAESTSVIVNVDLRKNNTLYINEGTYGCLFDAGIPHFIFPVHLLRLSKPKINDLIPFSFYGPTCDSLDYMKGPFYLPKDVRNGDYIEIGQIGAYGRTLSTGFNGFRQEDGIVAVTDEPLMTMYEASCLNQEQFEIIAA